MLEQLNRLFFNKYLNRNRVYTALFSKCGSRYTEFKTLLVLLNALFFFIYFVFAIFSFLVLYALVAGDISLALHSILPLSVSLYVAGLAIFTIRDGGYVNRETLVVFNIGRIRKAKASREIKDAILDLENELEKYNKRRSGIINILTVYISYFVSSTNIKKQMKNIKVFFKNCETVLNEMDEVNYLNEIKKLDKKICKSTEYTNMQEYLAAKTGADPDKGLFSFLHEADMHLYTNRPLKRIVNFSDALLERLSQHIKLITILLIFILFVFFPDNASSILEWLSTAKSYT